MWQTPDPQVETLPGAGVVGVWDLAPVTVANGVVSVASMAKLATQNQMFALDAATGAILWQFGAGSSVNAGPAVVNGSVYSGLGLRQVGRGRQRQQHVLRVQPRWAAFARARPLTALILP